MLDEKRQIIKQIIKGIEAEIKTSEAGSKTALTESRAHKGAMESRHDTFKEEAQALMGAYEKTLVSLRTMLGQLNVLLQDPPEDLTHGQVFALVELKNLKDDTIVNYLLLPAGGGNTYLVNGKQVTVISLGSLIAKKLIGVEEGDEFDLTIKNRTTSYCVMAVT